MFVDFETIGACGFLTAGVVVVGVAPPTDVGDVFTVEELPADTPPVAADATIGVPARISMLNTVEHKARNRTATSFVGLRS